jgi:hypothetical protein
MIKILHIIRKYIHRDKLKSKPTFREFIEKEAPHLIHKYEALYEYKL